jgi:hypothetical protein
LDIGHNEERRRVSDDTGRAQQDDDGVGVRVDAVQEGPEEEGEWRGGTVEEDVAECFRGGGGGGEEGGEEGGKEGGSW